MPGKKKYLLVLILLFGSWFLFKNLWEFRAITNNSIPPSPVRIAATGDGDDIYFRGYVFRGVRTGDILFRQIGINWGSFKDRLVDRFIALGIPGFYEHASIYIGKGKVYNISPDDPKQLVLELNINTVIEDCPADHIHFVRLTDDHAIIKKMISFVRLHKELSNEGKVQFIANERNMKKVKLNPPRQMEGCAFEYYFNGFNCVNGLIKAFDYAGLDIERTIVSRRSFSCRLAGMMYFVYPSEKNLRRLIDSFFFTGYQIKLLSVKEVSMEKVQELK